MRFEETATISTQTDGSNLSALLTLIKTSLEDDKAENIISIDLAGKTSFADYMVIADGRSQRHVGAISQHLIERLTASGTKPLGVEGQQNADWVLIDAGAIVIHIFRPEVRAFYNLDKIWSAAVPPDTERAAI